MTSWLERLQSLLSRRLMPHRDATDEVARAPADDLRLQAFPKCC